MIYYHIIWIRITPLFFTCITQSQIIGGRIFYFNRLKDCSFSFKLIQRLIYYHHNDNNIIRKEELYGSIILECW